MSVSPILNLGYIEFEVSNLEDWERFAKQTLGLPAVRQGSWLKVQLDTRSARIFCKSGSSDDILIAGWEAATRADVDLIADKARAWGVPVEPASVEETDIRDVDYLVRFSDPMGVQIEVCCGLQSSPTPPVLSRVKKGFKTDPLGLGHYVLLGREKARTLAFYHDVLGMKLSDTIVTSIPGLGEIDATFLHSSPRHHSVAIADVPAAIPLNRRLDHFMLEVHDMDDVGAVYDQFIKDQRPIIREFGKHSNDLMFSFYGQTPALFHVEIGCDGVEIDDAKWTPVTYPQISLWGHVSPPPKSP